MRVCVCVYWQMIVWFREPCDDEVEILEEKIKQGELFFFFWNRSEKKILNFWNKQKILFFRPFRFDIRNQHWWCSFFGIQKKKTESCACIWRMFFLFIWIVTQQTFSFLFCSITHYKTSTPSDCCYYSDQMVGCA